ncbi:hypothetical protein CASFOL_015039 [Castilleja foliolosa]|uniref:Uncharacterized protein n=1 Tax=Castilleja foliolosa TaxID=1961234 RepID=A0ABD3DCJ8_9LAMI
MRREGRQRGMVRTFPILLAAAYNPRPSSGRNLNELSAPPTAGIFTKAPSKPTNHSKFTGKCGRPKCNDCHIEPSSKSKDKAKGTHKSRTTPSDLGLMAAVGPAMGGVNVSGFSAIDVLDYLDDGEIDDDCYIDEDDQGADECCDYKFSSQSLISCC